MDVLYFLLGILVGIVVNILIIRFRKTDGILRIDHSNPEKDIYRFEIDDLEKLTKKNRVALKVDNHAYLSQK